MTSRRGTMVNTMAFIRVADLEELPEGRLLQREVAGTTVAVCKLDGVIHAFNGLCPHRNGPLGQGNLVEGRIVCPWHAWEFFVESGQMDYNPAITLQRYEVTIQDDDVLVDVPREAAS